MKTVRYYCVPRMRQTVLTSAIALCLHNLAWAKLPDTGQDKCYGADSTEMTCPTTESADFYGQDGNYSKNPLSYTDNKDGTITDNVTGLMWQQDPDLSDDGKINSEDMLSFEDAKAGAAALDLAGHKDWRLPTIKELYSLMDFSGSTGSAEPSSTTVPADAVPYIDKDFFKFEYGDTANGLRYIDAQYWSSTEYVGKTMAGINSAEGDATAFGVNFADGRIKGYGSVYKIINDGRFVRYVRGGDNYGVNSFTDNKDGTISDASTELMWLQEDSGSTGFKAGAGTKGNGSVNWQEALKWCEGLDYAGHDDWRLPNAKELQNIVDYTRSPSTSDSAAIDPLFKVTSLTDEDKQTNYPFYWTSTTHRDGPDFAVYIAFGEALGCMAPQGSTTTIVTDVHGAGAQRSDPKTANDTIGCGNGPQGDVIRIYNYARCVRDDAAATSTNNVPTATNVAITGTLEEGQTLTGSYTYGDADNDPENGSTYQWYRADDAQGTNPVEIAAATATTYKLTPEETGKFVKFCVVPVDGKTAVAASEAKKWAELTTEEQSAATKLGYNQAYWDDPKTATATPNASTDEIRQPAIGEDLIAFWNSKTWDDLTAMEQSLWGELGWDKTMWDDYKKAFVDNEQCSAWSTAIAASSTTNPPPANNPPTAANVAITGTLEEGQTLTGDYQYSDTDNDPESGSTYQWHRADDAQGANATAITGATAKTYQLTAAEAKKSVKFCVIPADGKATTAGSEVCSSWSTAIAGAPPVTPPDTGTPPPTDTGTGTPPPTDTGTPPTDTGTVTSPTPDVPVLPVLLTPPTTSVCTPATNTINCVYAANGQNFTGLTLMENGNLSGALLSGNITNAGWISNATIAEGTLVTGGTLTGFIVNKGTLADITFRGASITGGILMGTIINMRNGLLMDVNLAANAQISGGQLQGLIKGDCTAPAKLENMTITSDSNVSCVTLGENVIVEAGAKVKEGGTGTTPPADNEPPPVEPLPVEVPDLPELGQAIATRKDGVQVKTTTTFKGGIAINESEFQSSVTPQKIEDVIDVKSLITVNPDDVGGKADLVVYAAYQATSTDKPILLMLDAKRGYHLWDEDVTNLVAFQEGVTLGETHLVDVYNGVLLYGGTLKVTIGYRKANGTVVLSPTTLDMAIAD